jgi:hypothetical protein
VLCNNLLNRLVYGLVEICWDLHRRLNSSH